MSLPDSGDVARMRRIINRLRSYGVDVREMPGWESRGFTYPAVPTRIFDHHDASSRKSGEWGSLGLILDGTPRGIPGPLSNFQVGRCLDNVPKVAVVAAGYAYHAGVGGPWNELARDNANPHTYGAEKANDGLGEPYTAAANYATNALFHAAAVESGAIPESFPLGHKEWTTRKSDPTYSMPDRRRQVAAFTPSNSTEENVMNSAQQALLERVYNQNVITQKAIAALATKVTGIDVDVDEDAIIAGLVPILTTNLSTLSDADVRRIAEASADELASRVSS